MIFTGNEKNAIGDPTHQIVDSGSGFSRAEPLLTTDQLRHRFLFGIPMYSTTVNPVTKRRDEFTAEMQKDAITRAINKVELHSGVHVQSVTKTRRLPFDRNEYQSLGYLQLPDKPVTKLVSFTVRPSGDVGAVYEVPLTWVDNANFHRGQLNIIAYASVSQNVPSMNAMPLGAGGSAFLSFLGQLTWIPSWWEVVYVCGFPEGSVPIVVNELIGITAAQEILSLLGATNRVGSWSVGIDAAQQSVNTPGVNIYDNRIQQLEAERQALMGKVQRHFGTKIIVSNV